MSETRELLATLRDIGEPPPPEGSPPLLIFANVALALLIAAVLLRRARRRRRAWLELSLAAVRDARGQPPEAARLALATLLRRLMRHRHGPDVDALHGEAWLARLDETFDDDWFTRGPGRLFGDALYAPVAPGTDTDALGRALASRLRRLPPRAPPPGNAP